MQSVDTLIIGAGLSGLTAAYRLHQQNRSVMVLEAADRVGGWIQTHHEGGYTFEGGPNTFPSTAQELMDLCRELGLEPQATQASASKRYLYLNGKLTALPQKPWQVLTTPVLSPWAKLRLLKEPFQPKCQADDMSVAGFLTHRVGRAVVENLVDPFISGIYAGNVNTLSMPAVFPKLWQWEQEYGSIFKGLRHRPKKEPTQPKSKMQLMSVAGGLQTLTHRLAQALPAHAIRLRCPVQAIEKADATTYQVRLNGGEILQAQHIILAVPAFVAAALLDTLSPDAASLLRHVPYSSLAVAHLGFRVEQIPHVLDGFGCLIPRKENIPLLAAIWASSLFPERAPQGHVLLSNFIGGAHYPEILKQKASQIQGQVTRDLQTVFHLKGSLEPVFSHIQHHPNAIPQYNLGHVQRIAGIEAVLQKHKGLHLAGNYLHGIALNACVQSGTTAAQAILTQSP
ncbi:protoporphyrinogen oxidase [Vampirovibrio chlorellavorus]|uniref:protoporphyrinogen oxidase n=1 Tax=Vampirovibrio chlorellavorus TaxID=758823 RepID=UPI0026EFD448|nr:protoporphyrinogen oxidase [Vampirovibrio chlorellavorus]